MALGGWITPLSLIQIKFCSTRLWHAADRGCASHSSKCFRFWLQQPLCPCSEYSVFKRLHEGPQMLDKVLRMNISARCARQFLTKEKCAFSIRRAACD